MLLTLFKSIFITVAVAGVIGYFLIALGVPFFNSFAFCILVQFLFFYFYGEYLKNKKNKFLLQRQLKEIEEENKQSTVVTCPCDRAIQTTIPIDINYDNSYTCPGCDKSISVFISTKTALATIPVAVNPLDVPMFVDMVEKKLKEQNDAIRRK